MANAGILYDKYTVIQKLQKRGFSHEQAGVVGEVLTEADLSSLATKADLELALAKQTMQLLTWMTGMLLAQAALVVAFLQYLQ
jgi:hypothetical protein